MVVEEGPSNLLGEERMKHYKGDSTSPGKVFMVLGKGSVIEVTS